MKAFDFDCIVAVCITIVFILTMHLYSKTKRLETEVAELRIVVNQRFLPALIFDKNDFRIRE